MTEDEKKDFTSAFKPAGKARILVADDDKFYLKIYSDLINALGYECLTVENGLEALEKARYFHPDIIVTDVLMPGMDGFELTKRLKQDPITVHIPVLIVTSLSDSQSKIIGLEHGANEFLSKPIDETEFRIRVSNMLKIKYYEDFLLDRSNSLEGELISKRSELKEAFEKIKNGYTETVYRLTLAAEYRDTDTGKHIKRISLYSQLIARYLKLDEQKVEVIFFASPMHDVGKIGIPDSILLKPGSLTKEEFEIMKTHTTIGAGILRGSDSEILKTAEEIALSHHELWNGNGYPRGLKNEEIPLPGRIVSIVDSYDAIRSKRPYKKSFDHNTACDKLTESKARYDPVIFNAFHDCSKEFKRLFDENQ
ncbi:MAG: response regulator [Deltaproteobacteria bacterium]|nr:response regulator [Deltaproteobacteria bacterium]